MRIERVEWRRFRIPFRSPYETAAGTASVREGVLVWLHASDGLNGIGEASLLPEAGGARLPALTRLIEETGRRLAGVSLADADAVLTEAAAGDEVGRAVSCAFDTAMLDLEGRLAGASVARLLSPTPAAEVEVNAVLSVAALDAAVAAARRARAAGFATVKLKVGMVPDLSTEERRVAAVREALGPAIKLRLDANGAWSADVAMSNLAALSAYDIELIEQPVAPGRLDDMRRVRQSAGVKIAADEDVDGPDSARRVIQAGAADLLVLKPMRLGGLRAAREAIDLARAAGVGVFVTSTIDTGIGIAAALQLAATLPDGSPACGLATAELLAAGLLETPLAVERGRMPLPAAAGLGVALDSEAFARYAA